MSLTTSQAKSVLLRLSREEKEELLRLPPAESMVILELYYNFPGMHRVEDFPPPEKP